MASTPSTPFAPLRPAVVAGGSWLVAALAWALLGSSLPGGRWVAVHLLTLGAVTGLIVALTDHFARTLLREREPAGLPARARHHLAQLSAAAVVLGRVTDWLPVLAAGATCLMVAVLWLYRDLRRARRRAVGARFVFVVRTYERAAGAFVHAGVLGLLLGLGVLGSWHGAARLAHLHLAVLGWAGLTLLATLVFFGPTVLRRQMAPGAGDRAARALPAAATALTVAAFALLATGFGGSAGTAARLLAAGALAVYAAAATAVLVPVLQVGRRATVTAHGLHLLGACGWFLAAVWADVAVVATGRLDLLPLVGLAVLVGVVGQAVLATVAYLSPMLGGGGPDRRARARRLVEGSVPARPALLNLGIVAVLAAELAGPLPATATAVTAHLGWAAIGAAALAHLLLVVLALRASSPQPAPL